jgi:hypothetical protein
VQNFRTIGQEVFVGWVPENRMFPQESEVVLNTVLIANALARDIVSIRLKKMMKIWQFVVGKFSSVTSEGDSQGLEDVTLVLNQPCKSHLAVMPIKWHRGPPKVYSK